MTRIPAAMLGLLLFVCPATSTPAPYNAEAPDIALARAFVDLMETGYPGPDFSHLAPWAILRPLALLDARNGPDAPAFGLHLRACLLAARAGRIARLQGQPIDGWSQVGEAVASCRGAYRTTREGHASFCLAAALESTLEPLPPEMMAAVTRRCPPSIAVIAGVEQWAMSSRIPPAPEIPADVLFNEFEARYLSALQDDDPGPHASPSANAGTRELLPDDERAVFDRLQAVAAGEAVTIDDLLAQTPPPFADRADGPVLRLAARAMVRAARTFQDDSSLAATASWLVEATLAPEVVAVGEPALAVGLAFIWALLPESAVLDFIDQFLRRPAHPASPEVVFRVALEIVTMAARNQDAELLQQSLVLLKQSVKAPLLSPQKRFEAEFFLRFGEWLDGRLTGRAEDALRRFQDRALELHARIPKRAEDRVRSLVTLNLLAAASARQRGVVHELEPHLHPLATRNTTYHILWISQFLEQRQTARAQAVVEWCLAGAHQAAAKAACHLWDAYYHELISERAQALEARDKASALIQTTSFYTDTTNLLLLVEGERRVGFVPAPEGRLRLRTSYSPALYLVPLPRLSAMGNSLAP